MSWSTPPHLDGVRLSCSVVRLAKGGRVQRPANRDIGDNHCVPFGCCESTCNIWCYLSKDILNKLFLNGTPYLPQCAQAATVGQLASYQVDQPGPNRNMGREQEVETASG